VHTFVLVVADSGHLLAVDRSLDMVVVDHLLAVDQNPDMVALVRLLAVDLRRDTLEVVLLELFEAVADLQEMAAVIETLAAARLGQSTQDKAVVEHFDQLP
jgi:hypothetical protein